MVTDRYHRSASGALSGKKGDRRFHAVQSASRSCRTSLLYPGTSSWERLTFHSRILRAEELLLSLAVWPSYQFADHHRLLSPTANLRNLCCNLLFLHWII